MLKFLTIICCCCLSFINKKNALNKKDVYLLRVGMIFTVAADYCLIIAGQYVLGVFLFCIVQQIYHYRFTGSSRTLYSLAAAATTAAFLFNLTSLDAVVIMGTVYSICILSSLSGSFIALRLKKYPYPTRHIIPVAMCLFLLCDINVALYNTNVFPGLSQLFFRFIWIFYLPSQFLLALS